MLRAVAVLLLLATTAAYCQVQRVRGGKQQVPLPACRGGVAACKASYYAHQPRWPADCRLQAAGASHSAWAHLPAPPPPAVNRQRSSRRGEARDAPSCLGPSRRKQHCGSWQQRVNTGMNASLAEHTIFCTVPLQETPRHKGRQSQQRWPGIPWRSHQTASTAAGGDMGRSCCIRSWLGTPLSPAALLPRSACPPAVCPSPLLACPPACLSACQLSKEAQMNLTAHMHLSPPAAVAAVLHHGHADKGAGWRGG